MLKLLFSAVLLVTPIQANPDCLNEIKYMQAAYDGYMTAALLRVMRDKPEKAIEALQKAIEVKKQIKEKEDACNKEAV
jgi:hypothetical protein